MQCHILQSQRNKFQIYRTHVPSASLSGRLSTAALMHKLKKAARAWRLSASLFLTVHLPNALEWKTYRQALVLHTVCSHAGTPRLEKRKQRKKKKRSKGGKRKQRGEILSSKKPYFQEPFSRGPTTKIWLVLLSLNWPGKHTLNTTPLPSQCPSLYLPPWWSVLHSWMLLSVFTLRNSMIPVKPQLKLYRKALELSFL